MWAAAQVCLLVISQLVTGDPSPLDGWASPAGDSVMLSEGEPASQWPLVAQHDGDDQGLVSYFPLQPLPGFQEATGADLQWPENAMAGQTEALAWDDAPPPLPATQFTATYLSRWNERGLGIASVDLRHAWLLGYDEYPPLNITPGAAIHWWSGPQAIDLPPRLYDVYLDLQWEPWRNDQSSILVGAAPGLFGDFELIDSQTFQWSGWFLGSHRLGEHWTLLGGVAYLRQLRSNWLPIGGAVWVPSDFTRAELVFPCPRVARRWRTTDRWTTWGYVAGQFGGGAWSVMDAPEQNVLVGYNDLRLLAGIESFSGDGHEWRIELGYVFARELSVNSVALDHPSDALLAQLVFAY